MALCCSHNHSITLPTEDIFYLWAVGKWLNMVVMHCGLKYKKITYYLFFVTQLLLFLLLIYVNFCSAKRWNYPLRLSVLCGTVSGMDELKYKSFNRSQRCISTAYFAAWNPVLMVNCMWIEYTDLHLFITYYLYSMCGHSSMCRKKTTQ